MSGIKRTIDNLNERARQGDRDAQETLSQAGLWQSDADQHEAEQDYFHSLAVGDYGGVVGPDGMIYSDAEGGL